MNAIIVVKAIIASNNTTPKAPIVNAIYMFHITGTKIIMVNATGISAINLFTPVSYTHLDVYKRQQLYNGIFSIFHE